MAILFQGAIKADPVRLISAVSVFEASMVVESRMGASGGRELDLFLHRAKADVVPFDGDQAELARHAWRRFGRARHPAGLNFGDCCCSYALAKTSGEPLLYKGDDFRLTDVETVADG